MLVHLVFSFPAERIPLMSSPRPSFRAIAAVVGLLLIPGCLPWDKSEVRQNTNGMVASATNSPPSGAGKVIAPRRNGLKTAILARDPKHVAIGDKLWSLVDEQFLSPESRRLLNANGLRLGVVSGSLPVETEAMMSESEPRATRVDPVLFDLPDGDPTEINLVSKTEPITLLLTREGRSMGKDYSDARGVIRVTATQDGAGAVNLKLTPEIHYGPVTKEFTPTPTNGALSPSEFMMKTGQQVEHFRDLAVTVTLKPGQVAVVGGRSDAGNGNGRDLGSFLFTEAEEKSDRTKQKVLLIWANPYGGLSLTPINSKDVLPASIPSQSTH